MLLALRSLPEEEWPLMDRLQRWRRLAVPGGTEMERLGRLAGVPEGILRRANAELGDGLTPAGRDREGYRIKVPDAYYDRISAVLSPATLSPAVGASRIGETYEDALARAGARLAARLQIRHERR